MDASSTLVSLDVKLWTKLDFENVRKRNIKNNLIQVVIGWVLMITFGMFFGGDVLDLGTWMGWIGSAIMIVGLWLGVFKWIYGSMPEHAINNINNWQKQASQQLDWFRTVTCPKCGQNTEVNIGYLEYNCPECRNSYIKKAAVIGDDSPEKVITQDSSCPGCKKPIIFRDRPAQFLCPNCNSDVQLERIPLLN